MENQAESLRRLMKNQKPALKSAKNIFAFTSGKGGTGKTFLSTNISYQLSKSGAKVLFVDFDSNLSNADVLLNINPEASIIDFLRGEKKIVNCLTKVNENYYGIFGESGVENFPHITISDIDRFIENLNLLSHEFDFIIIDTGAGINGEIMHLISLVYNVIVVINPEPTTIMDAYAVLKFIHNVNNKKFIIVNSSYSQQEGEFAFENINKAVSHFLKIRIELLGILSHDSLIRQSIIEQKLFAKYFTNSTSFNQLSVISQKLLDIIHLANIRQSAI